MRKNSLLKAFIKIICVLLSFAMTFCVSVSAENEVEAANISEHIPSGYTEVTSNQNNTLYADMSTGDFVLENKTTGKLWYSIPDDVDNDEITVGTKYTTVRSQISVGYIERSVESATQVLSYANSSVYCTGDFTKVETIKNGIKVTYEFEDFGFVIPVTYTLKNDFFEASILANEMYEPNEYFIVTVNLLPVFGAGNSDAIGKMFIPDGAGAFVNYNNGIVSLEDYVSPVYGQDVTLQKNTSTTKEQSVKMPVFALLTEGNALAAVISEGDANASITFINGNEQCGYNAVSSIFNYRSMMNKEMFGGTNSQNVINRVSRVHAQINEYTVRYYSLDDESILTVAECYRNYLIEEKKLKISIKESLLNVDLYGSVDTEGTFLGIPYRKQIALTEYKQALDIIKQLNEEGANSLSIRYIGWNNFGVSNLKITNSAKASSKLGGKKELNKLIKYVGDEDIELYLDNDIIHFRKSGNGISKKNDSIKTIFGENVLYEYNMLSSASPIANQIEIRFLKALNIKKIFEKFMKSFIKQKYDLKTVGFSAITNTLYSDLNSRDGVMRDGLMREYKDIMYGLNNKGYNIVADSANAYAFPYASKLLNVPTASSMYNVFDEEVPFYEMVLHGMVSMSTSYIMKADIPENQFLKSVELGCGISYSGIYADSSILSDTIYNGIYSSTFDMWKEDAVKYYKEYTDLYSKIYDKVIIGYSVLQDNVVKTTYENGISVYVNYNDIDITVEGITVEQRNFAIKEEI